MSEDAYILGAVIQGYTAFLTQSELDHASEILHNLYQKLTEKLPSPQLENDSLLCELASPLESSTLLDQVESLAYIFGHTRDAMHLQTTCTCTACQLLPNLQLKIIVHRGDILREEYSGKVALTGRGIMLVRAMLANHRQGNADALFTQACQLGTLFEQMTPTQEDYEHFGTIPLYAYALAPALERYQKAVRVTIAPETAWFEKTVVLPVSAAQAWDYINLPQYQKLWRGSDEIVMQGRMGQGAELHCIHGSLNIWGQILDWQPFEYVTYRMGSAMIHEMNGTIWFMPVANGTQVQWAFQALDDPNPVKKVAIKVVNRLIQKDITKRIEKGTTQILHLIENREG